MREEEPGLAREAHEAGEREWEQLERGRPLEIVKRQQAELAVDPSGNE